MFYRSASDGGAGGNFDAFQAFDSLESGKQGEFPVDDVVFGGYRERNPALHAFGHGSSTRDSAVGEGRVEVEVGAGSVRFGRWGDGVFHTDER